VPKVVPWRFGGRRPVVGPDQIVRPGQIARQAPFDGQLGRRRFRGRFPWLGGAGGVIGVPVPVGIDANQPLPDNPPAIDYDNGFGAYPQMPVAPQIIVLPDAPTNRGGSLRRSAFRRDQAAPPSWRSTTMPVLPQRWAPHFAHHRVARRWYDAAGPSCGYAPSPIALAPCTDGTHEAIYNTPCGVRPYE
jgi:hypothetical protein